MSNEMQPDEIQPDEMQPGAVVEDPPELVEETHVVDEPKPEKKSGPMWNIYVVMLLIAFVFLSAGCLLLFIEYANFGYDVVP